MNVFIHTFSFSVNISWEERDRLFMYKQMPLKNIYKGQRYEKTILDFCKDGLQIHIQDRTKVEIRYDKRHCPYKMELVVTPYKLLHPGHNLGAITEINELIESLQRLENMINKIEQDTEIPIRGAYKMQRVDITCDVETPSETYSREIIAASKVANLPYGYQKSEPKQEEVELYGWNREHGSLFYNKSQAIYAKIYNKKENLRGRKEYYELENKGLIRYEIELTRKFLRNHELLEHDMAGYCLLSVMQCAPNIMKGCFLDNLYDKPMFSQKVLDDYIESKYKGKTIDKMKQFSRIAGKCKRESRIFDAGQCGVSEKVFDTCCQKFDEIGISPIPADDACPYIPSIEGMLLGAVEKRLFRFAEKKTRGKELWYL